MISASDRVASLMALFRKGDKAAAGELFELLYPELRRLAAAKMRGERSQHTWQPTVLVNELYLTLLKVKSIDSKPGHDGDREKAAFLSLAGHIMKRLLIEHARPLYRRVEKLPITDFALHAGTESLQQIDQALSRLSAVDPRLRSVVQMKVFEGMTADEIAVELGCSRRSVESHWQFAKGWLRDEFSEPVQP